jgi:2'-5' RNA ligase
LLHITLAPVGSADCLSDTVVANAIRAGSMIRFDPIEVTLDRAMSFNGGSRWAQVLRCKSGGVELADLRKMLGLSLWFAGLDYRLARGFAPHVTLLYDRARIPETALTKPLTWTVRELVLVRSLYGQGRHIHLGRWPLCG